MNYKGAPTLGLFDSGIGGVSILIEFCRKAYFKRAVYLGDNLSVPYGGKSERELVRLAGEGVEQLLEYGANIIVLACNTLSSAVLADVANKFPHIPFFGVFPPVELSQLRGEDYLLLATERTVSVLKRGNPTVKACALSSLASHIESNVFNLSKIDLEKCFSGHKIYPDKVILGCTHYAFLAPQISAFFHNAEVVSGAPFTVEQVNKYIQNNQSNTNKTNICSHTDLSLSEALGRVEFIGESCAKNRAVFEKFYNFCFKP